MDKDLETAREFISKWQKRGPSWEAMTEQLVELFKAARAEEREGADIFVRQTLDTITNLESKLKSVEVSDEEINELRKQNDCYTLESTRGFSVGFCAAQELRAIRCWPSETEIKDVAKHEDSDGYFGFLSGCEYLRTKLCGSNGE